MLAGKAFVCRKLLALWRVETQMGRALAKRNLTLVT